MADLNKVFLIGNLTRDPEVRYTPSGKAVSELRLAVNRRFRGQDGQDKDETCFVDVVVWGRQAETAGEYLQKGSPVFVEGRLQYDEWEKDGQRNSKLRVVASRIQFLGGRGGSGSRDSSNTANAQPASQGPQRGDAAPAPADDPFPGEPPPADQDSDNLPF